MIDPTNPESRPEGMPEEVWEAIQQGHSRIMRKLYEEFGEDRPDVHMRLLNLQDLLDALDDDEADGWDQAYDAQADDAQADDIYGSEYDLEMEGQVEFNDEAKRRLGKSYRFAEMYVQLMTRVFDEMIERGLGTIQELEDGGRSTFHVIPQEGSAPEPLCDPSLHNPRGFWVRGASFAIGALVQQIMFMAGDDEEALFGVAQETGLWEALSTYAAKESNERTN